MNRLLYDMHVHLLGNGASGSGCWINLRGRFRLQARWMLHHVGLPQTALSGDLDTLYVEQLRRLLEESSLDRIVLLGMDRVYDEFGGLYGKGSLFYVPNEYLLQVTHAHPEFCAGVSIHPARVDAFDELERCLAGGAALLKLLPNGQNVDCNNRRYQRFWERMAEARLPLLAHTAGELTLPVFRPEYSTPEILRLPLECGVTVIAAHAATQSGLIDPNYLPVLLKMMERYPNLYADCSAFNLPIRSRYYQLCSEEPLRSRLLHGSDFPVPVFGIWSYLRGQMSYDQYRRIRRITNVIERDFQLKRAVGLPDDVFSRVGGLLRVTISGG